MVETHRKHDIVLAPASKAAAEAAANSCRSFRYLTIIILQCDSHSKSSRFAVGLGHDTVRISLGNRDSRQQA